MDTYGDGGPPDPDCPGNLAPVDNQSMIEDETQTAAPTPSTLDEVDKITSTPRSARIGRLFPGGSDAASKPLNVLIEQLIEVSKATLIPKSKSTKSIKVDVDSVHTIIVHGIPTTFNPTRPEDIELLTICNGNLLNDTLFLRWLKKDMANDWAKRYSSLLIGFKTISQANLAVCTKVWHGKRRHRTELRGPPPA
ncbi:hypothetical protein DFH28DRAFT_1117169 [Melampsora americana]|nr:hypothetical protein DFH28DRAFT_1117169 [Melampsora americana]